MNEQSRALRWLSSQLSPIGPVYAGIAEEDPAPPYIVINWQGGNKQGDVSGYRLMDSSLYQVQVVGPASMYDAIEDMADAMDAAIQRGNGTAGRANDALILLCKAEQPIAYDELVNGIIWNHTGNLYRIFVVQAPNT